MNPDLGDLLTIYGTLTAGFEYLAVWHMTRRAPRFTGWFSETPGRGRYAIVLLLAAWIATTYALAVVPISNAAHITLMIVLGLLLAGAWIHYMVVVTRRERSRSQR